MIEDNRNNNIELNKLALHHLDPKTVVPSVIAQKATKSVLQSVTGTPEYIDLVRQYELKSENSKLLDLAILKADEPIGRNAVSLLLDLKEGKFVSKRITSKDSSKTVRILTAMSSIGSKESIDIIEGVALSNSYSLPIRKKASEMIGKSQSGEDRALGLLRTKKVPAELIPNVVEGVKGAWRKSVYIEAATFLSGGGKTIHKKKVPPIKELLALKPFTENGKAVFERTCNVCHQVNGVGADFGPKLTEIGSKLPKEGLLNATIHPSAGIVVGFETSQLNMKDGSKLTGIIVSKTETDILLKYPGGTTQNIKTVDVKAIKQLPESMMPAGLHEAMTKQELADLVQYLSSLKKKE